MQEFTITEVPAQKTLSITFNSTPAEFKDLFPIWMPKVYQYGLSIGAELGVMFGRYHEFSDERVILEIGVTISGDVKTEGEITQNEIPAAKVVLTKHIGPYDTLIDSWNGLYTWLTEQGHELAGPCWESYVTGPPEELDSSKWVTEIYQPIK